MSTPVPGWYPDPNPAAPPGFLRWWDGGRWTEHVRPEGQPGVLPRRHGPTTEDGQPLAGWWWRVLAYLVDTVVVAVVGYLLTLPVQLEVQRQTAAYQQRMLEEIERGESFSFSDAWAPLFDVYADHLLLLVGVPIVLGVSYWCGLLRWRGATLGMLMCGLRVRRRAEDGPLPWSTIATRFLAQLGPGYVVLPLALATGSVGLFIGGQLLAGLYFFVDGLTALGARRQTIHDRAARTVVVTTR
jgi:uncharacterized RDD family membrane protein YckC